MRLLALAFLLSALPLVVPADAQCLDCGDGFDVATRSLERARFERALNLPADRAASVRRLRLEVDFAEAQIASLRRRLADYRQINSFGTGNALGLSADRARLEVQREQAFVSELRQQIVREQRLARYERAARASGVRQATAELTRRAAVREPSIVIVNH